uniref:Ribonuclease P protein subunit p29 n=1 Tax=Solanum tuberosum TaxID=4113 RepID=M0ZNE9_SOLTU
MINMMFQGCVLLVSRFFITHPVCLLQISGKNMIANDILHDLLQHGDSAQKYMQGSKNVKVDNWILLDSVVQKSSIATGARSRALQRQSKRSKRHMSIRQHKKFGSFDLPQEYHNYDIFKPMHDRWKNYVTKLLKNIGKNQLSQCLLNADLHGALILVVQCKIAGLVGVRGIMIRETIETFGIISEDNKFQVVPKKLSVFMLQVDCWKVTLLGDKLISRNMTA